MKLDTAQGQWYGGWCLLDAYSFVQIQKINTMKITELKGKALRTAIAEERKTEWEGKNVSDEDVIALANMNDTRYDKNGHFVRYGRCEK